MTTTVVIIAVSGWLLCGYIYNKRTLNSMYDDGAVVTVKNDGMIDTDR